MSNREITGALKGQLALNPAAITTSTTTVGNAIDTQGFDGGVNFNFFLGTRTDGTFTPEITECATEGGSYTAVANANLVKQDESSATAAEAQAVLNASNTTAKIGAWGTLRYLKFTVVSTSVSSGAAVVGCVVNKLANIQPVV